MPGLILAAITPDNTPHGYNWTFAFPMLLFIVIALILYALFSRPHRRIPGRLHHGHARQARTPRPATAAGGLALRLAARTRVHRSRACTCSGPRRAATA